ncbi:MAG: 3'-5' exonuclease [Bacteroidota bacterium]
MNYIVYDLEATCWNGNLHGRVQEVIEIGAFSFNDYGEPQGSYNRFVKPILYPFLSPFCQELTSIRQEDVDRASKFPKVIEEFQDWACVYEEEYVLCSWGSFDRNILISDCKLHDLDYDWVEQHINLKEQYQQLKRLHRPCGLQNALKREGIEFTGTPHRGISDAENLAKIFFKYLDVWQV